MHFYVESQVQFQTILAVLNLILISFHGVLISAVSVLDRQVAQLALAFSTVTSLLTTTIGEIRRYRIRNKETIAAYDNQSLLASSETASISSHTYSIQTAGSAQYGYQIHPIQQQQQQHYQQQRRRASPKSVSKNFVFMMSAVLFINSYCYHPLSIVFGMISQPIPSRYEQPLSFASNKTYTAKNFNNNRIPPLYTVDADYNNVLSYEKDHLISGLYDDSINGNAFQILGTTFYQSGNMSCGLRDEYNVFMLESQATFASISDHVQMTPRLECLLDSGVPGNPIRPTFLKYKDGDDYTSYVKAIGKVPREGDNFTIFAVSGNSSNNEPAKLTTMTLFMDRVLSNSSVVSTAASCLNYINNTLVTSNYTEGEPIYGAINYILGTKNYTLTTNLTQFYTYSEYLVRNNTGFTSIFTVKDKQQDKSDPRYNHYVRNTIYFGMFEADGYLYYNVFSTLLYYRTGLAVYNSEDGSMLPKDDVLLTALYSGSNKLLGQGSVQIIPPMLNVMALPTAISIISAFIPSVQFKFADITYFYGHRLKYDVTALVWTVIVIGGLALIIGLICYSIFRKSSSRRIPQYYNLLRDYHERNRMNPDPLIDIVKPAYRGAGFVGGMEMSFNHVGILNLEAAKTKPLNSVRYLGKRRNTYKDDSDNEDEKKLI